MLLAVILNRVGGVAPHNRFLSGLAKDSFTPAVPVEQGESQDEGDEERNENFDAHHCWYPAMVSADPPHWVASDAM